MLGRARAVARLSAGFVACGVLALVVLRRFLPPVARGFVTGAWVTLIVVTLAAVLLISSGRAISFLQGALGEGLTADEFTRRRRRRAGWRIVHDDEFDGWQVDHIAVGPGGVLAIESKWVGGDPWRIIGDRLVGPVRCPVGQAQEAARHVRRFIASTTDGGPVEVDVRPVVVVWGPGAPELGEAGAGHVDGVLVVEGPEPASWATLFDGGAILDADQRSAAFEKLASYARRVTPRPAAASRRRPAAAGSPGSSRR